MKPLEVESSDWYPWWCKAAIVGGVLWWVLFFAVVMGIESFIHDSEIGSFYFKRIMFVLSFPVLTTLAKFCGDSRTVRAHLLPLVGFSLNGSFWGLVIGWISRRYKRLIGSGE